MLELLLPAGLVIGALWYFTKDSDSASAADSKWTPAANPSPLDGTLLDNYLQPNGQGGYKPIAVRFILANGSVKVLAHGTIVDAKVSHDASAGPTGTRLWLVSFDSFDPASLAAVDLKTVPGGKVPNPPAKGAKFTLTDKNFA